MRHSSVYYCAPLFLLGLAVPASAEFNVCNKMDHKVSVAVGYIGYDGYVSEGWWTIHPGGCKTLVGDDDTTDPYNYFLYAKGFEGETALCTTSKPFTIVGRNCNGRGFNTRYFQHIESSTRSHTTNLRDGSGSMD